MKLLKGKLSELALKDIFESANFPQGLLHMPTFLKLYVIISVSISNFFGSSMSLSSEPH